MPSKHQCQPPPDENKDRHLMWHCEVCGRRWDYNSARQRLEACPDLGPQPDTLRHAHVDYGFWSTKRWEHQ